MNVIIVPLLYVLKTLLNCLNYALIAHVIITWLFAFNIVNSYNPFVNKIADILHRITEVFLRPLRNSLPTFNGIDFSPFVLLLGIMFFQHMLDMLITKMSVMQ